MFKIHGDEDGHPYTGITVSYICSGSGNNFYRLWFPDLGEDSLCDDADYYRSEFTLVENLPRYLLVLPLF